jgi:hypothetical protein
VVRGSDKICEFILVGPDPRPPTRGHLSPGRCGGTLDLVKSHPRRLTRGYTHGPRCVPDHPQQLTRGLTPNTYIPTRGLTTPYHLPGDSEPTKSTPTGLPGGSQHQHPPTYPGTHQSTPTNLPIHLLSTLSPSIHLPYTYPTPYVGHIVLVVCVVVDWLLDRQLVVLNIYVDIVF